jgi:hypothetical protein
MSNSTLALYNAGIFSAVYFAHNKPYFLMTVGGYKVQRNIIVTIMSVIKLCFGTSICTCILRGGRINCPFSLEGLDLKK